MNSALNRRITTMSSVALTPGMRVLCRDAEWLVTRVDPSDLR